MKRIIYRALLWIASFFAPKDYKRGRFISEFKYAFKPRPDWTPIIFKRDK